MNLLLISLQKDLDTIGLKYLHYYLLGKKYHSHLLYLPHFKPDGRICKRLLIDFVRDIKPGLIGISLMSTEYHAAAKLTLCLRDFVKSAPIVWGGIHPTISPEQCLRYADYVCVGEGERTMADMAEAVRDGSVIKKINNLLYCENGDIRRTPLYPLIEDLDTIPPYEHIPANSYVMTKRKIRRLDKRIFSYYARYFGKIYSAITTRGCPFSCTYCCNNSISRLYPTKKVRRRSIDAVMEELEKAIIANPEIESINFQDDCFLHCSDDHLKNFCAVYKERITRPFIIRAIPRYINEKNIAALKESGIGWISLGLQSGSDRVCRDVYKRNSFKEDFIRAARLIKRYNIAAFYDIILDNPFETEEDNLETIETLIATPKPFYTQLFSLVFYKGTELYERAKAQFPEYAKGYLTKDYSVPHRSTINILIRLSTLIDDKDMRRIVNLYKRHGKRIWFMFFICIIEIFATLIITPITYFRVIKLSKNHSYMKTFRILPLYIREGSRRLVNAVKGVSCGG